MTVVDRLIETIKGLLIGIPIALTVEFIYDKIEKRQNEKMIREMDKGKNERKK